MRAPTGASGVHVGQDDLPASAARVLLGASAIVASPHTREQVEAARAEPITYLAVGPIFGSRTRGRGL